MRYAVSMEYGILGALQEVQEAEEAERLEAMQRKAQFTVHGWSSNSENLVNLVKTGERKGSR